MEQQKHLEIRDKILEVKGKGETFGIALEDKLNNKTRVIELNPFWSL